MRALALPLLRPIATGAIYTALVALGIVALSGLPVALAPDLELPRLTVSVNWPGAAAGEVEALVTAPIEARVHELPDVREVASSSSEGLTLIDVAFERSVHLDLAEVMLRERLSDLRNHLPIDIVPPAVERTVPRDQDGGNFLVLQAVSATSADALRRLLEDRVVPRLLAVPGVAGGEVIGGARREIQVDLDRSALERGLVSAAALDTALDEVGRPVGVGSQVMSGHRMATVVERPAPSAEALASTLVAREPVPVSLGQVASVRDGWADPLRLSRINGRPAVYLILEREPGSNVIEVADGVHAELDRLQAALSDDVTFEVLHDQSKSVRRELATLVERSGLSILAIFVVMVLVHRRLRSPLVVLVSVLFSALISFLFFRAAGIGMNLVTLSGLALAFGMAGRQRHRHTRERGAAHARRPVTGSYPGRDPARCCFPSWRRRSPPGSSSPRSCGSRAICTTTICHSCLRCASRSGHRFWSRSLPHRFSRGGASPSDRSGGRGRRHSRVRCDARSI